jgi:hypothetical protein
MLTVVIRYSIMLYRSVIVCVSGRLTLAADRDSKE